MMNLNALTKPGHCASIKIQGFARSQRRATMSMDITVNTVETSRIAFDTSLWPLSGDKRRNRNATEHFVSHSVMI
jgi:hypothetical protein